MCFAMTVILHDQLISGLLLNLQAWLYLISSVLIELQQEQQLVELLEHQ
jgi:hypothetical protein